MKTKNTFWKDSFMARGDKRNTSGGCTMYKFEDMKTISEIAHRAAINGLNLHGDDYLSLIMDIECCHEVNPLNLHELSNADLENFAHDVVGIQTHIDRETRTLKDCFVPRFSR